MFTFEESVKEDEVALEKLRKTKGDEWKRVGSTSRRHDVWIKPVRLPNGDEVGVFELTTRLASNHPLYNPDNDERPPSHTSRLAAIITHPNPTSTIPAIICIERHRAVDGGGGSHLDLIAIELWVGGRLVVTMHAKSVAAPPSAIIG